MYIFGWGANGSTDGIFMLQPVLASHDGKGDGDQNFGRFSNARLDELTARIKVELDPQRRLEQIRQALAAHNEEINDIPLHRQVIPWAERANVTAPHRPDNHMIAYRLQIQ
jgi:peptide/nickel transport system substrate-binding protein